MDVFATLQLGGAANDPKHLSTTEQTSGEEAL